MYEFLRFYIHCTGYALFCISARVREAASTNVLLVLCNSAEQHCVSFREWISFWMNRVSQWFNGSFTCFVSIESVVLNESFDMNDSVSHLLKQGLAATYWRFYCHIYLCMTDLNQPRCQHKNTFSKILFNYQYLPKFVYFRSQKKKKKIYINNNSFNKANFCIK